MAKKDGTSTSTTSGEVVKTKSRKKSDLRREVERVAKATGLPTSFIWKRVRVEQKSLKDAYTAEITALAQRVESITRAAMKALAEEQPTQ